VSFVTSVKEITAATAPTEFALAQNYPNPFWSAATSPLLAEEIPPPLLNLRCRRRVA